MEDHALQLEQEGFVVFQLLDLEEAAQLKDFIQDGSLGTGLGWHTDYPYHDIDSPWPPPEVPLGCQVLICLDDFREDNGGTMFMPNSHKAIPAGLQDDFDGTMPGSVVLQAPAGSALIAHSAWWHRQTSNTSQATRTALLGNFTPGYIVPKDNMEKQWHLICESKEKDKLTPEQQQTLENLMLGSHRRGLFAEAPHP